jgi:hypothetical protein
VRHKEKLLLSSSLIYIYIERKKLWFLYIRLANSTSQPGELSSLFKEVIFLYPSLSFFFNSVFGTCLDVFRSKVIYNTCESMHNMKTHLPRLCFQRGFLTFRALPWRLVNTKSLLLFTWLRYCLSFVMSLYALLLLCRYIMCLNEYQLIFCGIMRIVDTNSGFLNVLFWCYQFSCNLFRVTLHERLVCFHFFSFNFFWLFGLLSIIDMFKCFWCWSIVRQWIWFDIYFFCSGLVTSKFSAIYIFLSSSD